MTPAAAIAELEAPAITSECRGYLLALVRRQPEYRAGLLLGLHGQTGSYAMTLRLLGLAGNNEPAPPGSEDAYQRAVALMQSGYQLPPSEEALRKRIRKLLSGKASAVDLNPEHKIKWGYR